MYDVRRDAAGGAGAAGAGVWTGTGDWEVGMEKAEREFDVIGGAGDDDVMKPGGGVAVVATVVEGVLPNKPRISSIVDCWDFGGGFAAPAEGLGVGADAAPEDPNISASRS